MALMVIGMGALSYPVYLDGATSKDAFIGDEMNRVWIITHYPACIDRATSG